MKSIVLYFIVSIFLVTQSIFAQLNQKWLYSKTDNTASIIVGTNQMDDDAALEVAVLFGFIDNVYPDRLTYTSVSVFDGLTGALEGSTPELRGMHFNKNNTALADIDGDNKFELITAYDGVDGNYVVCYEFGGSSDISTEPGQLVEKFSLTQNYPNPFNPTTSIEYEIQNAGNVEIIIFDELGQVVKTLVNEEKTVGEYTVSWDGKNDSGTQASTGVYYYQLKAGDFVSTKKMILMK